MTFTGLDHERNFVTLLGMPAPVSYPVLLILRLLSLSADTTRSLRVLMLVRSRDILGLPMLRAAFRTRI